MLMRRRHSAADAAPPSRIDRSLRRAIKTGVCKGASTHACQTSRLSFPVAWLSFRPFFLMVSRSPGEFGCSWRTHAHHSASVSPLSCVFFGVASEPRCRRSAFGRFPSVPRVSFFFHADVILSIFACAACYFLAAPLHLLPFASACCSNIASSAFFVAFSSYFQFPFLLRYPRLAFCKHFLGRSFSFFSFIRSARPARATWSPSAREEKARRRSESRNKL